MKLITVYNKRDWDLVGFVLFHQTWGFQGRYYQDKLAVGLGSFGEEPRDHSGLLPLKKKKRKESREEKHKKKSFRYLIIEMCS